MGVAPIEYPPPVESEKEFVAGITDPEDERIEVGVVIVGGVGMRNALYLVMNSTDSASTSP